MPDDITEDQHQLLGEYQTEYTELRSRTNYPGSMQLLTDYAETEQGNSDAFFEKYGVGNNVYTANRADERATAYLRLLHILKLRDPERYARIHKGTPYYFIGWTSFQRRAYEEAMFYLDAAVSEDIRTFGKNLKDNPSPATSFFQLDVMREATGVFDLHVFMSGAVADVLRNYNERSGSDLSLEGLKDRFAKPMLFNDKKHRSILTSLYRFVLEYPNLDSMLKLRSAGGGSIDPFLNHLFRGACLLESLLGIKTTDSQNTLGRRINALPQLQVSNNVLLGSQVLDTINTRLNDLREADENFQNVAFGVSYTIRNTTGHSLVWSDIFTSDEIYSDLYNCLIDAIFWSIERLFLDEQS